MIRNLNIDPATTPRPTWAFVALLAVGLVVEVLEDHVRRWIAPAPFAIDYDGCAALCGGRVASVTRDGCWCATDPR